MSGRYSAFKTLGADGYEALVEFDRENPECWIQVSEKALRRVEQ